ncbi:MAG: hypothetical protein IJG37_01900 [Synergistaceae bacterium]|nr:hypothetical protein [Synergistaceae bacterium]MBQ4431761.1 hypothetical protein [Synergistaceae bacterium]MBQ7168945.1 hypothetical protein [Synergistaceae bacterium]
MKRSMLLAMLAVFAASAALAGVQDFGKFTVDVPAGWTGTFQNPTAVITKNDNTAALTITIAPTEGLSRKEIADAFVAECRKSYPTVGTPEADNDGDYTWEMTNANGVKSSVLLTGDNEEYCAFVMTGLDVAGDEISAMLGSVKDK